MAKNTRKLFDSDDEDVEFEAPKIDGRKGSKLLSLQSKLGGVDQRFRLNEKFLDDDDDDERKVGDDDDEEKKRANEERSSNFRILEKVLGKPVRKEPDQHRDKRRVIPYLRFDPDNPAHRQFEVVEEDKMTESVEDEKSSSEDETVDDEEKPSQHATGVDPDFAETLRKRQIDQNDRTDQSSRFSLRKLFNRDEAPVEEKKSKDKVTELKMSTWQLPLVRAGDSSDEEPYEEAASKVKEVTMTKKPGQKRKLFFLYDEADDRMAEGERFRRMEDVEVIRKKWEKQRFGLIQFYKSRRKEATKRQRLRNERDERKKDIQGKKEQNSRQPFVSRRRTRV